MSILLLNVSCATEGRVPDPKISQSSSMLAFHFLAEPCECHATRILHTYTSPPAQIKQEVQEAICEIAGMNSKQTMDQQMVNLIESRSKTKFWLPSILHLLTTECRRQTLIAYKFPTCDLPILALIKHHYKCNPYSDNAQTRGATLQEHSKRYLRGESADHQLQIFEPSQGDYEALPVHLSKDVSLSTA